ncbi:hypothetical protein HZS_208, partial [Henneguya salminicola]
MVLKIIFLLLLCSKIPISFLSTQGLSAATVLLPKTSQDLDHVMYDLFVSRGEDCFKMSNSRNEVIQVVPKETTFNEKLGVYCVNSVQLISVSTYNSREGSIIQFSDVFTGLTLKTHAFVDKINKIEIVTRRRILYIGEAKEKIEVIAYDDFGNIFSSLLGALFEWRLSCPDTKNCKSRLPVSIVSFQSSNYDVNDAILKIESKGFRGNLILLEPLFKGDVMLTVRMRDPIYQHISASVVLTIREYIVLEPSETQYFILSAYYTFKAFRLVRNTYEEIKISPHTYELSVTNGTVAAIHTDYKTVIAQSLGDSIVSLSEKLDYSKELEPFQVSIHVVDPTHLILICEEQENWVLELHRVYVIRLQFLYFERVLATSNLIFDTNFTVSNNISTIILNRTDSQSFNLEPNFVGISELSSRVTEFMTEFKTTALLTNPLSAMVQIEIVNKIQLSPLIIVCPYIYPLTRHLYSFQASGGTGRYYWFSTPTNIFSDSLESKFVTPAQPGTYNITCIDRMNKHIRNSSTLKVLPLLKIILFSNYSEVPTSHPLFIRLQLLGYESPSKPSVEITHYSYQMLKITFSERALFSLCDPNPFSNHSFCFVSSNPGCSIITVSVANFTEEISSSIRVCAFMPLEITSKEQYAIPGSFIIVNLTGGPLSVSPRNMKQNIQTSILNNLFAVLSYSHSESPSRVESIKFQCVKPGNERVKFVSSNSATASYPHPYQDILEYTLTCFEPEVTLKIHPFNNDHQCSTSPYILCRNKNMVYLSLYAKNGFFLHDFSGFVFSFASIPSRSLIFSNVHVLSPIHNINETSKASAALVISPKNARGITKIVVRFTPKLSRNYYFDIVLPFYVVKNVVVEPRRLTLLDSNLNSKKINIRGGSGHFDIDLSSENVVMRHRRFILDLRPIVPGFSVISIRDICISTPSFKMEIFVTKVKSVSVIYPNKVPVNDSAVIEIIVYNDLGLIVPNEEQHLLKLHFLFLDRSPDEIIKNLNNQSNHIMYTLYSFSSVMIEFIVEIKMSKNLSISSDKCKIEFYDPVKILPSTINMIPGMEVKLKTIGGPSIGVMTKFYLTGNCVRFFPTNNSLISYHEGRETVTAIVYSMDSDFKEIVYSQFQVFVTVSDILSVQIDIINNKFYRFTNVPASLHIFNIDGLVSPYISLSSAYSINWNVEKTTHISLDFYGRHLDNDQVMLTMSKEGSTPLNLKLSYKNNSIGVFKSVKATKMIYILRSLSIFSCSSVILLPPNIVYDLKKRYVSSFVNFHFSDSLHLGFTIDSAGLLTSSNYPSTAIMSADVRDSRQDISHHEIISFTVEVAEIALIFFEPLPGFNSTFLSFNQLPVGQVLSFNIIAIDNLGRRFDYIPQSFINFTIIPLGIIEIVEFKNMMIAIKGLNLGPAYIYINSNDKNIRSSHIKVTVNNPFSFTTMNLTIGQVASYKIPIDEFGSLVWTINNPHILVTSEQTRNKIFLLGYSVGDCLLRVKFEDISYDILYVKVQPPSNLRFSDNSPHAISNDHNIYYFDIISDSYRGEYASGVVFDRFPFICKLQGDLQHFMHIQEGFNEQTGLISCVVYINETSDRIENFPLNLEVSVFFPKDLRAATSGQIYARISRSVSYYSRLSVLTRFSTAIDVDQCIFDGISISRIEPMEQLQIYSSLECINTSYYINAESSSTLIVLKLSPCFKIIHSNRQEFLYVVRKNTKQKITIRINIIYDMLPCLHPSFFGTLTSINPQYNSPKPCSLKRTDYSFGDGVDPTTE